MILKRLVVGPFASNCYIVGSEKTGEGMIVDAGDGARQILKSIEESALAVNLIVLTHFHIDHFGAVREVKEATGASMAMHAEDAGDFPLERASINTPFGFSFPAPPPPDRLLRDGDIINVGDLSFTVIHTPGHTPGGICLAGHGVVFTGDTLFNYGIGRTDLPGGNYSKILNSIHDRLMKLPGNTIVCPGHGPESTIDAERAGNPFLRS